MSTAVRLRFDLKGSPSLPEDVRRRLITAAGRKLGADGFLTIHARAKRTQEANRREAVDRLVEMIAEASVRPEDPETLQTHARLPETSARIQGKHSETKARRRNNEPPEG